MRDPFPSIGARIGNRFHGKLAMHVEALAWLFESREPDPPFHEENGIAIVSIDGPLMQNRSWWADSYEAVGQRMTAAIGSPCTAVVMCINSPGGELAGCFELVADIRAQADAAGKPLIAYVDGNALSGGYALACAADQIFVPPTGRVGSIGVIDALVDVVGMDQQDGINWAVIASGTRKADGHPHVPIGDDTKAAVQSEVDGLAEIFFALVAGRRKVSTDVVRSLQAGIVHGDDAVTAKLADGVARFSEVIAKLGESSSKKPKKETKGKAMKAEKLIASYDDIMGQLKQLADEDSDEGKKAKDHLDKMKTDADGDDTGSTGSTGSKGDDKKEAHAMRAAVLRETGAPSVSLALMVLAQWKGSHIALESEQRKMKIERETLEAGERRELVIEMVKLGTETPATAWKKGADGLPDGKNPASPWDTVAIASLRERVAAQRVVGSKLGTSPRAPASAEGAEPGSKMFHVGDQLIEITAREQKMCAEQVPPLDVQKYAEKKAKSTLAKK